MNEVVFLVDVDNTLLDNDHIQADIKAHLERQYGAACRDRYWAILDDLFVALGYRDYLGALQRYRVEHPRDMHLLSMSSFLVDYPFANRLYPGSLDVLERLRQWGPTILLTDGDVVFQPRKVERSRELLTNGTLRRYLDDQSLTGLTSNPTIFDQAIKSSSHYDAAIRSKLNEGKSG